MRRKSRRAVAALLGLIVTLSLSAQARADTSEIGKNVGNEVKSWATALIFGVAAIVGLPLLFKRDVNGGLVLALLVIVIGGFVFAPAEVRQVIRGLWHAIGG